MLPAGYLYKTIAIGDNIVSNPAVHDVYSLAGCISGDFGDYMPHSLHNGYWLFDTPEAMEQLAEKLGILLTGMKLFFYRIYPYQWNEDRKTWEEFEAFAARPTAVREPPSPTSEGFDVVSYSGKTSPECSPLSCNGLAQTAKVNSHCLFESLDEAKGALEGGLFKLGERGPFRIVQVLSL
jgi:hypothetical protein